ncbi:hypothetical protein B0H21DRAFT_777518 [Amylocystis lapponica]|nr:hypothetical protein B0H21DRAFT_777518 [Amylocystis lapponica]
MTTYHYELPTTGAFYFASVCEDQSASYITEIAETTEARANVRAALKQNKRTDVGEKDYLKLVKVLDDYLPQLCGILGCVKQGEIGLKSEPIFSWRTTLSSSLFHNSPRLSLPALSTELAFTLLTYAFSLCNLSHTVVHSLGEYERDRAISDTDRKAKDERLGFAVTLLCKAAGVFEFTAKECLAEWDRDARAMALADAQTLAIRKLLSRAVFDSTLTPGPPLPKSHPSPVLIAKLHLECAALYSSARSLAKTPGDSRPSAPKPHLKFALGKDKERDDAGDEVAPELCRYLSEEAAFHGALARKWMGVDAGENGGTDKGGIAVGFLAWAKKELEELKSGGGVMGSDREKEMRERRRDRVVEELGSVSVFLKGYRRINDTVSFQPVPPQSDLQASIPAGRAAVAVKAYNRPTPAFGPGSVEHTRRQAEDLELLPQAERDVTRFPVDAASPTSGGSYAGAGSYF